MNYEAITTKLKALDEVIDLAVVQVMKNRTQASYDKITAARLLRAELGGILAKLPDAVEA